MPRRTPNAQNKPLWSIYDVRQNPEHQLAESLVAEMNDIIGIEVQYYRRDPAVAYDVLYGEHCMTGYLEPITTKIIYDIGDEPNMYSSFGVFGGDTIIARISRPIWDRDIRGVSTSASAPLVGDVIHANWYSDGVGRSFEIAHVDDDQKTFQLRKLVWVLILKPFRYSEQSDSAAELTMTPEISAFGDNAWIETQSEAIFDYEDEDIDSTIYGF